MAHDQAQHVDTSAKPSSSPAPIKDGATEFSPRIDRIDRGFCDDPHWLFHAGGHSVELSTAELISHTKFWRRIFIATDGAILVNVPRSEHRPYVNGLLAEMVERWQ